MTKNLNFSFIKFKKITNYEIMTNLHHHLYELKLRFIYIFISFLFTFFIVYHYKIEIVYVIGRPFIKLHQPFIFLDLTEAFYTLLKLSTIFSFLLLIPFLVYHLWSFFSPSFYNIERNKIKIYLIMFFILWCFEILFIYLFLLPKICDFLLSFEIIADANKNNLQPIVSVEFSARIESYVNLIVKISSFIYFLFQIPFGIYLLYLNKSLHVSSLYTNRKIMVLISLLVSAFLVPPEMVTQLIVAFYFYILFEILIFIGLFFE